MKTFPTRRLHELVTEDICYGVVQPGAEFPDGIPLVRVSDLTDGAVSKEHLKKIDPNIDKSYGRSRLIGDELLLACVGSIGSIARADETLRGFNIARAVARVRCNEQVDRHYLYWFFRSPSAQHYFTEEIRQVAQPTLNIRQIEQLEVPVPPLPEQRRIADILDKADAIRRKRKQAIALTDQLLRSTFLEMFGDPVTNPKGWPSVPVESIAKVEKNALAIGPFGSNLLSSDYRAAGHPVIFVRDIVSGSFLWKSKVFVNDEKFMELAAHRAVPGDVLITKMGDPPGVACVLPTEFPDSIITADVVKVSANRALIHPEYLATMINSPFCQEQIGRISAGITRQKMTLRDFRQLEIRLPPLSEQSRYLGFVRRFERLRDHLKAAERDAQTLFSSLVDRAFRGELSRLEQVGKQLQMFSK